MAISQGKKRKHQDVTSDTHLSNHDKVKKKKRKITNLDVMYLGSSDTEDGQGRKNSKTQKPESAPSTAVNYNEEQGEEHEETSTKKKKKKRKEESGQEDDDITAGDDSSVVHRKHKKKCKKSDKVKDSDRIHKVEDVTEEAPPSELTHLEGMSKKKKKKAKKDQVIEDYLLEESLVFETPLESKKKKKGGGDLQEDDDESHRQLGGTEQLSSETPEQVGKNIKKKKKKRKEDGEMDTSSVVLHQECNEKMKKSHKTKDMKRLCGDEDLPEKTICAEPADIEGRQRMKKGKKDHQESHSEDASLTSDAQHTSKKAKRKSGGEESNRHHGVTEGPDTKRNHHKNTEQGDERADQTRDSMEELLVPEDHHTSKKKKKKKQKNDDCLQEDETLQQVGESMAETELPVRKKKKKKNKERTDEPQQEAGDISVDNVSSLTDLYNNEDSYTNAEGQKKKKKHKKDRSVEEVFENQHNSKKKKKADGGFPEDDSSHILYSQKKTPDDSTAAAKMQECTDWGEQLIKKKKKRKDKLHQDANDATVDEVAGLAGLGGHGPPYRKPTDVEDGTNQKKKKRPKKDHGASPSKVAELWNSKVQYASQKKASHGGSETAEPVSNVVDQDQIHVKKKVKNSKATVTRVETSEIHTEEVQLEDGNVSMDSAERNQSSVGREVERNANVEEEAEETSTRARSRPQTSADSDQNLATQDNIHKNRNEDVNRPSAADKGTENTVKGRRRRYIREQDLALIKEYFPEITEKQMYNLIGNHELERIRAAHRLGIKFRTGQFTIEEDELIKKNVQQFMLQVGIDSALMLLHPYRYPENKSTITELKRLYHFRQRIGAGLFRRLNEVNNRAAMLYDPATVRGRYSLEEVERLKKLLELHGNNWLKISLLMNRTKFSPSLKASQMRSELNTGKWSLDEMNLLISSVKEYVLASLQKTSSNGEALVTIPKERLYKGISWVRIQEKVQTRNWSHCKRKWFELILLRMNNYVNPFQGLLAKQSYKKMIRWLRDTGCRDYGDVEWDKLSNVIGNVPPFITQNKFIALKHSIPDWKKLRLYEVVNYLCDNYLPKIEEELSTATQIPVEPKRQEQYLISEMFQEYTEHDGS
ncbi:transcription termination factor 1 [Leptodactylus fuscus]|uniref:transcription termination factor 1 n=1 Tax=Leptodactylus fuscus TaxID=238119 RepID=UPI003F4F042D